MDLLWEIFACLVIYIFYMTCLIICEHVIIFVLSLVNITSVANATQVNSISMLNGTNFKVWKEAVEIVLGCMDLGLALRIERIISTPKTSNEVKIEKCDWSNQMCLMIMKHSIPEAFRGSISEGQSAKKFLEEIEQYFAKKMKRRRRVTFWPNSSP